MSTISRQINPERTVSRPRAARLSTIASAGLLLALALPASTPAFGQPLLDNLDQPTSALTVLLGDPLDSFWGAQTFFVDDNTYTLDSIDVIFGSLIGAPAPFVELRAGDDPQGALLATFSFAEPPAVGTAIASLIPDSPVTLFRNQSYTLVVGALAKGSFEWAYALGNVSSGAGAFGDYHYTSDRGVVWTNFGNINPYQLRINVTLVPCYPNCDDSTTAPTLNALDFACFLQRYRAGEDYANCDASTTPPVLNALDFACFLNSYRAGCP